MRVPRIPDTQGYKAFWVSGTLLCLRHIGDATVLLSKRGRNLGPKQTKIMVTNLDEWIARQVVSAYRRKWPVEQIHRKLKTDLGLGAQQVRGEEGGIEKSFGVAVLTYVLLIRACHQEILPGSSPLLRPSSKARHTRLQCAFAYCVHFVDHTPCAGSA